LLLVAATIAGGCTSPGEYFHNGFKVGPNYHQPPSAVSNHWIDSADSRVSPVEPPNDAADWWMAFNDPVLTSLVEQAYKQNLPLKEAAYRVLAARAQYGFAIGSFFPQTQQASAGYSRRAISETIANHQYTPYQFFDVWNGGFNLSWEIDLWGRYRRAIFAARAELQASAEDYDAILVTLIGDVAQQYITLRTREAEIKVLQENVAITRKILAIATERFQGGVTGEVDVEQIKALLGTFEAFIPGLEVERREAANALCVLLGIPTVDLTTEFGPGMIPPVPPNVAAGIPADLLRRRPDVRRAERHVAEQSEQIGIATANLYPAFFINGTIGVSSSPLNRLFEPKSLTGGVGPSFQWPILNYGRLVNNIHVQEANFQERVVNYQNTVLVANKEAEDGLVQFLKYQEQARLRAGAVAAARKAVDLALDMYQEGRTDITRVFQMEREVTFLQREYVKSLGAIDEGLIYLYRSLGGGWQIRLRDNDPNLHPQPTRYDYHHIHGQGHGHGPLVHGNEPVDAAVPIVIAAPPAAAAPPGANPAPGPPIPSPAPGPFTPVPTAPAGTPNPLRPLPDVKPPADPNAP
jgi:NodT family efflux transporter outer membrane factor (OMF) lipoprotein